MALMRHRGDLVLVICSSFVTLVFWNTPVMMYRGILDHRGRRLIVFSYL